MYGLYKDEKKYFVQTRNTHDKNKLIVQSGNHGILNRIANNLNLSLPVVQLNKNIDSENSEEENIIEQPTKSNTIIHKSFETSLNVTGQKNCNNINLRKLRVECSNPDNTRKRNFCYYCKKIIWIHVAKHFEQMHKDEEDVKKCLLLPKGNRERQRIIKNLRQKGNYLFNQNPAYNKGELIVCRRPTGKKTASDFICCVDCKGFFSKNAMYMHSRRCTEKGVDRSVIQLGKKTQSQIHECANSILRNVFPSKEDNITRLIRYDELVIIYGNNLCEKYTDRETIRYRLRLLGRFLQTLRKINKNVTDFYSLYHPSVYDDCITALKQLTGFNTSTKVYALHSVASILYAFLRQMGNIGIAECIKRNKLEEKINIENFLQLFQEDYNKFVNKNDKNSMLQDECNQLQELLSSDDIKLLHYFLQTNRRLAVQQLKDTFTYNAWRQLAEFTLISIQVFNRKRKKAEIIECMSIDDYKHQEGIKINEYPDMYERISLPDEARETSVEKYTRIPVRRGKNFEVFIPVFLDCDMKNCIDLLLRYRTEANIHEENPYIFALPDHARDRLRASNILTHILQ